jgi:hypothetical protein
MPIAADLFLLQNDVLAVGFPLPVRAPLWASILITAGIGATLLWSGALIYKAIHIIGGFF